MLDLCQIKICGIYDNDKKKMEQIMRGYILLIMIIVNHWIKTGNCNCDERLL